MDAPAIEIQLEGLTLIVTEAQITFLGTHALISAQAKIDAAKLRTYYLRHLELGGKHLFLKDGREITDAIP